MVQYVAQHPEVLPAIQGPLAPNLNMPRNTPKIAEWEQQPKESVPAFAAFAIYRDMGAERSLDAVQRKIGKNARLLAKWSSAQALGRIDIDYTDPDQLPTAPHVNYRGTPTQLSPNPDPNALMDEPDEKHCPTCTCTEWEELSTR